eukprot:5771865-Pleurochrysis_carterae.AAC.1
MHPRRLGAQLSVFMFVFRSMVLWLLGADHFLATRTWHEPKARASGIMRKIRGQKKRSTLSRFRICMRASTGHLGDTHRNAAQMGDKEKQGKSYVQAILLDASAKGLDRRRWDVRASKHNVSEHDIAAPAAQRTAAAALRRRSAQRTATGHGAQRTSRPEIKFARVLCVREKRPCVVVARAPSARRHWR